MNQVGTPNHVNGLDLEALAAVVQQVQEDPHKGIASFRVSTAWAGQTRSESRAELTLGGERIERKHGMRIDEPSELLGSNSGPNPQEMLMAALNSCMMVGYVAGASLQGITLEKLEIVSEGELDLRGFLGLDDVVKPGYERLRTTVRIKGNGTPEQFAAIHENVQRTSPNYFNVSQPITIEGELILE